MVPQGYQDGNLGSPGCRSRSGRVLGLAAPRGQVHRTPEVRPAPPGSHPLLVARRERGGCRPGLLSPYTGRVFQGARASRSERSWGSAGKAEWRSWQPMKRTTSATESSSRKKRSR